MSDGYRDDGTGTEDWGVTDVCEHGSLRRQCLICELEDELAAWRQVWDALNEMGAGLGDANKPLAVTASWALLRRERDALRRAC